MLDIFFFFFILIVIINVFIIDKGVINEFIKDVILFCVINV